MHKASWVWGIGHGLHIIFAHLYCPRESKLLEDAFGHPGEDAGHWINPVLRVNLTHKSCHLQTIGAELSPKKEVHQEDVAHHIEKEEKLAEDHPECPVVVGVHVFDKVICQNLDIDNLSYYCRAHQIPLTFCSESLFVSCKRVER